MLAIALIACTVFAVALLFRVTPTDANHRSVPAMPNIPPSSHEPQVAEKPGKRAAMRSEQKEAPTKSASAVIFDNEPYDPKSFDKAVNWAWSGVMSSSPKEKALLIYEFCKRNNLLEHSRDEFVAGYRAAHRADCECEDQDSRIFQIDCDAGVITYRTLEFCVINDCITGMTRTEDYYVEPAVPLSSPHKTLFDDLGDGFIRYTRDSYCIEDEEEIQQLERAAGLTYEKGRRMAESFARRNCQDMRDRKRRFIFARDTGLADACRPIVDVESNGGIVTYSYQWVEKPLKGELYRYCNEVSVDINPKIRDIVGFSTKNPPGYDIAVREPPAIDSDSAFKAAERLLARDAEAIEKAIQETCEIMDDVDPCRPELAIYAADNCTAKMFWSVDFVYFTQSPDCDSYDSLTISIRVDAATGEACYEEVEHALGHQKRFPIKIQPCHLKCIAYDSAIVGILGRLPPPTLPKIKPIMPPDNWDR